MAHTAGGSLRFGVDARKLAAVRDYRDSPLYTEAERVALDFAAAGAAQPNEVSDELFDEILHVNARSMMMFCREVVPAMRRAGAGGSIVNVTSVAARHGGGPGASLYAGAKGFVSTATRGLAKELVADRIRVNAVAPGVIATPFHDQFSTPQMLEAFKAGIPMGRLGTPDECVGAFLYLASEALSGYVTGQILEVNGGQYMP